MVSKEDIKNYWNRKQPSEWYSKNEYGTKEYYNEVEQRRYNYFCPYIPINAEFTDYKGKKVLEVGVGMGTDLKQYAKNGALCYGTDLTEGAIDETQKHLAVYGLNANLQVMDAENLEFEDNTFDLVYSFGVLHHTPDTQKSIDEIYRVLKPGGKAIIMLYSKSWQHYMIRIGIVGIIGRELFRMSMQDLINKYSEAYGFSPLTKLYNKKEVNQLFVQFQNINISHWHYKVKERKGIIQKIKSLRNRKFLQGNWIIKAIK